MTSLPPQPPSNVPPPPGAPGQVAPTVVYLPPPMPHAPAPTAKSKTPLIVGIVAGVVAIGGLVGFLVSRNSGGGEAVAIAEVGATGTGAPAFDIGSPPVAPAVPGAGDVPTQVTLPAPNVEAPVTSAVTQPVTTQPVTTSLDDPPPTTAAAGGGSSSGGGTGGTVEYVDMSAGVRVPVPAGFTVQQSEPKILWMTGAAGEFTVAVYDDLSTADAAANFYVLGTLTGYLSDLEYSSPEPLAPDSGLVEVLAFSYRGNYVSQQSGSIPLEGRVYVNQRVDGVIIVQDITWLGPTASLSPTEEIKPPANYFLANFVYG